MRAVVAVLLFVTAAHAALWGLFQDKQPAPDFRGILPSLSYTPFEPGHVVIEAVDSEKVRADLKRFSTLTRATRRPRSRSDSRSPAAWARINLAKPNGRPGIFSSWP